MPACLQKSRNSCSIRFLSETASASVLTVIVTLDASSIGNCFNIFCCVGNNLVKPATKAFHYFGNSYVISSTLFKDIKYNLKVAINTNSFLVYAKKTSKITNAILLAKEI